MKRLVLMLILLSPIGCAGKLYEVHRGATLMNGVPFYVLAGSCTQETVYLETIYQLAIQVPKQEGTAAIVLMEKNVPASVYASGAMQQLREAVTATSPVIATIKTRFNALTIYDPNATPERVFASNTVKAGSYVDYGSVHYINVSRPGVGSASATAKLNADGTLSEGTADVEDKTAETLLGAFPIKETVVGILSGAGLSVMTGGGDDRTPRPVQLVVTPLRVKHTYSRTESANPPCAIPEPLPRKDSEGKEVPANIRREPLADCAAQDDKDDTTSGVSGKTVLPKKSGG